MNYKDFLEEVKATKSENTYKSYKNALAHFPKGTRAEIVSYIADKSTKDTTKKNHLVILRQALEYNGALTPAIRRLISGFRCNVPVQECPTKTDVDTIYKSLKKPRDRAMFGLMAYNGLRRGEILNLDLSDVLPDDRLLLRDTKGKADAVIPLHSSRVLESLGEYILERKGENPALFLNRFGERFSPDGFAMQFQRWLENCGLERFHPHSFRRYFANALDRAEVPVQQIQAAMRHKSPVTTTRYLNISVEATRAAMVKAFA